MASWNLKDYSYVCPQYYSTVYRVHGIQTVQQLLIWCVFSRIHYRALCFIMGVDCLIDCVPCRFCSYSSRVEPSVFIMMIFFKTGSEQDVSNSHWDTSDWAVWPNEMSAWGLDGFWTMVSKANMWKTDSELDLLLRLNSMFTYFTTVMTFINVL